MKRMLVIGLIGLIGCSSDDDGGGLDRDSGAGDGGGTDAAEPSTDSATPEPDAATTPDAATDEDAAASDDDAGPSPTGGRPTAFMLEGTAEAEDGDDRVECRFYATLDMLEYDDDGGFEAFAIGEAFRTTMTAGGGSEFAPLIAGPSTLTVGSDGKVDLRWVGDQPDDALEFWLELEVLRGEPDGDGYAGTWQCAPGLLGEPGFMDIDLTAPGTWTLEPL